MTTTAVYEQILAELAGRQLNDLQREIFKILRRAYPAAVSRQELIQQIYGYFPQDINKDTRDRKNRIAIRAMRELLIPIVSSSGEAGYRLDVSEEAICAMIGEWESRRKHLKDQIRKAEFMLVRIHQMDIGAIPSELPRETKRPLQIPLFGEA